jgi:hypothetical protein
MGALRPVTPMEALKAVTIDAAYHSTASKAPGSKQNLESVVPLAPIGAAVLATESVVKESTKSQVQGVAFC